MGRREELKMLYQDTFITVYILVLAFIFGTVFGSFITCMSYRIVNHESVLKGRSHCDHCNHVLGVLDLIPIFSYVFLKGRCRYCHEKISPVCLIAEILLGTVFTLIVAKYDVSVECFRYLILACILLGLSIVDIETMEIPDQFIFAGIFTWAVTIPFMSGSVVENIWNGLLGGLIVAGGMLLISLLFDKLLKKESMGGGDIKLFFMLGLYLGLPLSLFNLILSCIVGLVFAAVMRKNMIPFGPSISLAGIISILIGMNIVTWYLSLF